MEILQALQMEYARTMDTSYISNFSWVFEEGQYFMDKERVEEA